LANLRRLSDGEYDADLPYHQPNKGRSANSRKTSSIKLVSLKNELRQMLSEPLMARGISAKYPTGGSKVVVDELIKQTGELSGSIERFGQAEWLACRV
jgi:ATP-dependent RNA helicase DDX24/MAK5